MNAMMKDQKITKAKPKGARVRAKKAAKRNQISLAGGDEAKTPISQGQRRKPEDPRKVALEARVRVMGAAESDASDPMCGSGVGMCINSIVPHPDASAVWQTWQAICAAQRGYRTRILGVSGDPQGSAIAMLPDAMQADTGHTIDIRTADERDAAARRAWDSWTASIASLPSPQMIWAVKGALSGGIDGIGGEVWRDGKPTARGRALVLALRLLTINKK